MLEVCKVLFCVDILTFVSMLQITKQNKKKNIFSAKAPLPTVTGCWTRSSSLAFLAWITIVDQHSCLLKFHCYNPIHLICYQNCENNFGGEKISLTAAAGTYVHVCLCVTLPLLTSLFSDTRSLVNRLGLFIPDQPRRRRSWSPGGTRCSRTLLLATRRCLYAHQEL